MTKTAAWVLVPVAMICAGCQRDDSSSAELSGGRSPGIASQRAELAKRARGDLKCPAAVTPKTGEDAPHATADDIVGVRPGLLLDEAVQVVLCSHELLIVQPGDWHNFEFDTLGQPVRLGFRAGFPEISRNTPAAEGVGKGLGLADQSSGYGESKRSMGVWHANWYVGAIGMPRRETVMSVGLDEWFDEAELPSISSVADSLVQKYGASGLLRPPRASGDSAMDMLWYRGSAGDMAPTAKAAARCGLDADPALLLKLTTGCGLVISARIHPRRDRADLADRLQIVIVDMDKALASIRLTSEELRRADFTGMP